LLSAEELVTDEFAGAEGDGGVAVCHGCDGEDGETSGSAAVFLEQMRWWSRWCFSWSCESAWSLSSKCRNFGGARAVALGTTSEGQGARRIWVIRFDAGIDSGWVRWRLGEKQQTCKMEILGNEEYVRVQLLRKQYFQLLELPLLTFPPTEILIKPDIQANIYESMFNEENLQHPPPANYQIRVLKELLSRLENAITDPEEDVRRPKSRSS
jgi:hypothetical protein